MVARHWPASRFQSLSSPLSKPQSPSPVLSFTATEHTTPSSRTLHNVLSDWRSHNSRFSTGVALPDNTLFPSRRGARESIKSSLNFLVARRAPVIGSQIPTEESLEPERSFPSGVNATQFTGSLCPSVARQSPV